MSEAGSSAQREHDLRRARERSARRRALPRSAALVAAAAGFAYSAVLVGVHVAQLDEVVPADLATLLAGVVAAGAALSVGRKAWGRRATTESWAVGAEGERRTAALLRPLERRGWVVVHDRAIPGTRANIDHVVIGPPGVFVVESKSYGGRVVIGRRSLWRDGWRIDEVVDQARREAAALHEALADALRVAGVGVTPVVCVHRASVERRRFWYRAAVGGIAICGGGRLVKVLTRRPAVLDAATVERLGRLAAARLSPAAASGPLESGPTTCPCGGHLVLRHRRSDGEPFWGCSRYPACRRTRPTRPARPAG